MYPTKLLNRFDECLRQDEAVEDTHPNSFSSLDYLQAHILCSYRWLLYLQRCFQEVPSRKIPSEVPDCCPLIYYR